MTGAQLQRTIDIKLGTVAKKIGQPFSVYRCGASASGDFPGGWEAVGSSQVRYVRIPNAKQEVAVERGDILYHLYFNANLYVLGDIFVCSDPPFVAGVSYGEGATILPDTLQMNAFAFSSHIVARIPVGCRIDRRCRVLRPALAPGTLGDGTPYWRETAEYDMPLVLASGAYSFHGPGSTVGSWVPVGLLSVTRRSDYSFTKEPGIVRSIAWLAYLPPLPGYQVSEGDALLMEDGSRYVILGSFNQEVGVVGSQIVCDRKIAQTA